MLFLTSPNEAITKLSIKDVLQTNHLDLIKSFFQNLVVRARLPKLREIIKNSSYNFFGKLNIDKICEVHDETPRTIFVSN